MRENNLSFPRGIEVAVGTFVYRADGKFILIKSPKWGDQWIPAGGHVDPGESFVDAAVRETKEELGLDVTFERVINVAESINSSMFNRPAHFIFIHCVLYASQAVPLALDPHEVTDTIWLSPAEAAQIVQHDAVRQSFERLRDLSSTF
jgi:8-oxo-dGTP diphosphatase